MVFAVRDAVGSYGSTCAVGAPIDLFLQTQMVNEMEPGGGSRSTGIQKKLGRHGKRRPIEGPTPAARCPQLGARTPAGPPRRG